MPEMVESDSRPHALIVDDDEIMRQAAHASLTEADFLVSEAENGVKALQALEHLRPDIILLDVVMPEMDGFATASAIRQLAGCEVVPILIMTALDDLESINRAYEVGATDFITKPINWVILVQRVRYIMRAVRMVNEQKRLEVQLQQAQKMEAVATLAGGVAHDFNNLLQIMQASSELLLSNTRKDTPAFEILSEIMAAAGRGGELTQQLLTYSRDIESEKRPMNLNVSVRQVHQLLKRTIPKMIGIDVHLENNLKLVDADPVQMEQVLMNLAINARDAIEEEGSISIQTANVLRPDNCIDASSLSSSDQWVSLCVRDTGQGMSNDILEQIFDPFFSTKAPGNGTGLGLSMVHGIIKNHDGCITCRSTLGIGSCFCIYLPAVEPGQKEKALEEKTELLAGSETILLVDDDEAIRHTCKEGLEKFGYTVLTASRGDSALEMYGKSKDKIDLVLLDLIIPGMSGINCLYELLQINPQVHVVIISGYYPDKRTLQVFETSTKGYLRKPFTRELLLTTIRRALDGQ